MMCSETRVMSLGRPDRLRDFQAKGVPFRIASDDAQADVKLQVISR